MFQWTGSTTTLTGTNERISLTTGGVQSTDNGSFEPSISADGSRVVFNSTSAQLVTPDLNGVGKDIYSYKATDSPQVRRVSGNCCNASFNSAAPQPSAAEISRQPISSTGQFVVYLANNPNDGWFVYLWSAAAPTALATQIGPISPGSFALPSISGDGFTIIYPFSFTSGNVGAAVVKWNLVTFTQAGAFKAVLDSGVDPAQSNGPVDLSLNSDGSRAVFRVSTNTKVQVPADTDTWADIYRLDTAMAPSYPERVSLTTSGAEIPGNSLYPVISADGLKLFYSSLVDATIIDGTAVTDEGAITDVFAVDLPPVGSPLDGALTAAEKRGDQPGLEDCSSCQAGLADETGNPVDASTGVFWHEFGGIAVPGRGKPLNFNFTYNSDAATENSQLGFGWTHSYEMKLLFAPNATTPTTVTVVQEGGAQVPFSNVGGVWTPPRRADGRLTTTGSGTAQTWTLTRQGRDELTFDSVGRISKLRRLTDPNIALYWTTVSYPTTTSIVVTDGATRTLTITLNGAGKITTVADSTGRQITFVVDAAGHLTDHSALSTGGAAAPAWKFAYDANHRLTKMRKPNESAVAFPGAGACAAGLICNVYDAQGRVTSQTDGVARTHQFDYTTIAGSTKVTDPRGIVTLKTFQGGLLVSETAGYGSPGASTTTLTYDPRTAQITKIVDPLGRVWTTTLDCRGNPLTKTDPLGRQTTFTHDTPCDAAGNPTTTSFNNVVTVTAPNPGGWGPANVTTTNTYHPTYGVLLTSTTPLHDAANPAGINVATTYTRNIPGVPANDRPDDVTSTTDPEGRVTTFTYAATTGYLLTAADVLGNKTTTCYDTAGRVIEIVSPKGPAAYNCAVPTASEHKTTITYTASSQPLVSTQPRSATVANNMVTTSTYDQDGNTKTSKVKIDGAAADQTTTYTYDAADQLISVLRPDGTTTSTEFWPDGQVKAQKDAATVAILSYNHDTQGRLITQTDSLSQVTTFGYDLNGNVTTKTGPVNSCGTGVQCVETFTYNTANELTAVNYSDPATPDVAYTFKPNGQRATLTDGTGTTTYTYDSLGRLVTHVDGAAQTIGYGYDKSGRQTTLTYPGTTGTATYAYDTAGRPDKITDWANRVYDYTLDANGNTTRVDFKTVAGTANVNSDTFSYDNANQMLTSVFRQGNAAGDLTGVAHGTLTYTRDNAGRLARETSAGLGLPAADRRYAYSKLDQLCLDALQTDTTTTCATAAPPGTAFQYKYDTADNLTQVPGTATQKYNGANQLCWTSTAVSTNACGTPPAGATTYTYDSRGNRTAETGSTFAYDQANRMTRSTGTVVSGAGNNGEYTPITPIRLVDTRAPGTGKCPTTAAECATFGSSAQTVTMKIAGEAGLPAIGNLAAVVVNVTAVPNTSPGFFTLYPDGTTQPTTSNLNFVAAQAISNTAIVKVGTTGNIKLSTNATTGADAVLDIVGYITTAAGTSGAALTPIAPVRAVPAGTILTANVTSNVTIAGTVPGIPAGATAVAVNVTAAPTAGNPAGFLKAWEQGAAVPATSVLNWNASNPTAVFTIVKLSASGQLSLQGNAGATVYLDIAGWFGANTSTTGSSFTAGTPTRVLDTRTATLTGSCYTANGGASTPCAPPAAAGGTIAAQITGQGGVPTTAVTAIAVNLTAIPRTGATPGFIQVYPDTTGPGTFSNINYNTVGQPVANFAIIQIPANGRLTILTQTAPVDILIDIVGWYTTGAAGANPNNDVAYTYNGDGIRTTKNSAAGNNTFAWTLNGGLPLLLKDNTYNYIYGFDGEPIAQVTPAGVVTYLHTDQIGSVRLTTTNTGAVGQGYRYDPYGKTTATTGTGTSSRLRYTGQYLDGETGLYHLRARTYDPTTGTFTTRDPIARTTREHYAYVGGNPLNNTDPSGLWCVLWKIGSSCGKDEAKPRPPRDPLRVEVWAVVDRSGNISTGVSGGASAKRSSSVTWEVRRNRKTVHNNTFTAPDYGNAESMSFVCQTGEWHVFAVVTQDDGKKKASSTRLNVDDCGLKEETETEGSGTACKAVPLGGTQVCIPSWNTTYVLAAGCIR